MTSGQTPARAGLTLGAGPGGDTCATAEWPTHLVGTADRMALAMTVDYLAASGNGEQGGCDIADVIICEPRPRQAEAGIWLRRVLHEYPGCAVAAVNFGAVECLVATRRGGLTEFAVHGQGTKPALCAFLCGSFAYAWLCTGRQLTGLDRAILWINVPVLQVSQEILAQGGAVSCSLRITCWSSAGSRPASRSLTCPASGAPRSA
jgi:hypothetical protein